MNHWTTRQPRLVKFFGRRAEEERGSRGRRSNRERVPRAGSPQQPSPHTNPSPHVAAGAPPAHITRHPLVCAQCTRHAPRHVTSHVCTPLHWTVPRSPTVPAQLAMFEQESWQSAPHVGLQSAAPLQLMEHDAPHVPVHDAPFWHCNMQFAPVQSELLVAAEVDADIDVENGGKGGVAVDMPLEVAELAELDEDAVSLVVAVFATAPSVAPQSNVCPLHADTTRAIGPMTKSARIVIKSTPAAERRHGPTRGGSSVSCSRGAPWCKRSGTAEVPPGSMREAGRRVRDSAARAGRTSTGGRSIVCFAR
jgi:hypothetical protein